MTQLKSKSGATVFAGIVAIAKEAFYIIKKGDKFIATTKSGEEIGEVIGETVKVSSKIKHASAGKTVKLASLQGGIDVQSLLGKDPTTLSAEELIALTTYLKELAADKVAPAQEEEEAEEKPAPKKKKAKAEPVEEEEDEEDEDDFEDVEDGDDEEEDEEEDDKVEAPEGVTNYDELRKLGTKKLWAFAKPLGLDGINSRSKLDELAEALAEYLGFALPSDEEEEDEAEIENDSVEDVEDGEDEYEEEEDDEEEEEDDEEESDEEDEEEEDDSEDDEEEEEEDDEEDYDDDDEEEEDEDDKLTPADIDALETKQEIQAVMKKYGIKPPKAKNGKVKVVEVKAHIKKTLFGK